jgi:hypothetical protein
MSSPLLMRMVGTVSPSGRTPLGVSWWKN